MKIVFVALLLVVCISVEVQAQPTRGFLGVKGEDPADGSSGVTVTDVYPGSPAATAGIQPGDRIGSVNARPVRRYAELGRLVAGPPGTTFRLSVIRGDRVRDVTVTLVEPPPELRAPKGGARPPAESRAPETSQEAP